MATRFYPEVKWSISMTFKNGRVSKYLPARKTKSLALVRHKLFSKIEIKVGYGNGIENSGSFNNVKSAVDAINAWTEKPLLEYIYASEW